MFGQKCKMRPPATKGNKRKTSWETSWETRRKTSWETSSETRETKPREGRHTIQHRHTCWETMGDKGRQDLRRRNTPSSTGTHVGRQWETMARNRRQGETGRQKGRQWETLGIQLGGQRGKWRKDLGEADKPSNTGAHVRRQGETKRREGGHTIQHR